MRGDVAAYTDPDFERNVTVTLYQGDSVADVLDGTAAGAVDITDFTTSVKLSESSLRVSIAYDTEFIACSAQPKIGDLVSVSTDSQIRFIGILSSVDAYYEERGERRIDVTSRTRDGVGGWKTQRAVSPIFPLGTGLTFMLQQICEDLMALSDSEYIFPAISYSVPHTNAQFNDETPWNMISTVLEAANYVPYVNVLNQVSAYSKDFIGAQTVAVPLDHLISKSGASKRLAYDRVRLRWLDQNLQKSLQQSQILYSTAMTAGYFKRVMKEDTWYSDDHRQRAEDVYMHIDDSVNTGIVGIDVADEDFEVIDEYHGEIILTTKAWVPLLLTMATVGLLFAASESDLVQTNIVSGTGITISVGRLTEALAISAIMIIQMSIGVGRYEIWGVPYDYVHAKNTTLAYSSTMPTTQRQEKELDNDLIISEDHAQSVAVADLVFENAKATTTAVELIDDPRIEIGDILEFPDGTRMFVSSFSNDFTRGVAAIMKVEGMLV